jgi:hypothetical protein
MLSAAGKARKGHSTGNAALLQAASCTPRSQWPLFRHDQGDETIQSLRETIFFHCVDGLKQRAVKEELPMM